MQVRAPMMGLSTPIPAEAAAVVAMPAAERIMATIAARKSIRGG